MKIFKISGYMIKDDNDSINFNNTGLYKFDEDLVKKVLTSIGMFRQLHVEGVEIADKNLPENVDLADLEKYFDHRTECAAEYDRPLPQEGEVWRHFKGNEVKVVGIAQHTEWNTLSVVYTYNGKLFNRPLDMFMSEVDREKYPDAFQKYRFERVSGDARVCGNASWLIVGPIGSRDSFTMFLSSEDGIYVSCGCFYGSIDDFEKAVEKTHAGTKHERVYKLAIELAKSRIQI